MRTIAVAPPPPRVHTAAAAVLTARNRTHPVIAGAWRRSSPGSLSIPPRGLWNAIRSTASRGAILRQGIPVMGDGSTCKESDGLKTVQTRFVLTKKCQFGEQFFVVGDEPALGLWEPSHAVPLEWSEGHVWVAEVDLQIDRSIMFKFLLRCLSGEILWQPGPDRVVQTWETMNTIVIYEDWNIVDHQKIAEEQKNFSNGEEATFAVSETEINGTVDANENQEDIVRNLSTEGSRRNPDSLTVVEQPLLVLGLSPIINPNCSELHVSEFPDQTNANINEETTMLHQFYQHATGVEISKRKLNDREHDESIATSDAKKADIKSQNPTMSGGREAEESKSVKDTVIDIMKNDAESQFLQDILKIRLESKFMQDAMKNGVERSREMLHGFFSNLGLL